MKDTKNNIWIPKVGQGIFVLETNKWFMIESVLTVGSWAFYSPDPDDEPEDIVGVEVLTKDGVKVRYKLDEIRPETFCEYIKRPTGIGRTSWPQAIFNLAIITFGQIISIITWNDYGWVSFLLLFLVLFGWGYSTWRNFKKQNSEL
jgi:hypothetical protein